jgi:hypothetical protein
VASWSDRRVAISWWCWRRKASMRPTAAPAPPPAASPAYSVEPSAGEVGPCCGMTGDSQKPNSNGERSDRDGSGGYKRPCPRRDGRPLRPVVYRPGLAEILHAAIMAQCCECALPCGPQASLRGGPACAAGLPRLSGAARRRLDPERLSSATRSWQQLAPGEDQATDQWPQRRR